MSCVAGHPNFTFFQHDVIHPFFIEVNEIYHLACPASPPHYQYNPIKVGRTKSALLSSCSDVWLVA